MRLLPTEEMTSISGNPSASGESLREKPCEGKRVGFLTLSFEQEYQGLNLPILQSDAGGGAHHRPQGTASSPSRDRTGGLVDHPGVFRKGSHGALYSRRAGPGGGGTAYHDDLAGYSEPGGAGGGVVPICGRDKNPLTCGGALLIGNAGIAISGR